jgi:hypothetical protein
VDSNVQQIKEKRIVSKVIFVYFFRGNFSFYRSS